MHDPWEMAQCDTQGQLFELSAKRGYASEAFIKAFMTSTTAADLDKDFHHMQWAGKEYIMASLEDEYGHMLSKDGPIYDAETLYWTGHTYRYWHFLEQESSKRIYRQAPAKIMQTVYLMYHTMSTPMAIQRLKDSFNNKKK